MLFLSISIFLLLSCEKEEIPDPTTYQVKNLNEKNITVIDPYLNGSLYDVVVFCFNEKGDIVRQDNFDKIEADGGITNKTEVTDDIVKVKVSFKFIPKESQYYNLSSNVRKYLVVYNYLDRSTNTEIIIDGNAMVKNTITINYNQDYQIIETDASRILP